jgi:hypothetical protein
VCPDHAGPSQLGITPDNVRLERRLLVRRARTGEDVSAALRQVPWQEEINLDGPLPMLPVVQLYATDVPDLPCPPGTDLLQMLWCPFTDHDEDYLPRTVLRWRTAAEVRAPLAAAPQPAVITRGSYLPEPCVLHPETITEYPHRDELPPDLWERIWFWEAQTRADYFDDLSLAPGCKVGGHVPWSLTAPVPVVCAECGSKVRPLLTIEDSEWDNEVPSWRPIEESDDELPDAIDPASSTQLFISRGYSLQLYTCEASWDHPHVQKMQ